MSWTQLKNVLGEERVGFIIHWAKVRRCNKFGYRIPMSGSIARMTMSFMGAGRHMVGYWAHGQEAFRSRCSVAGVYVKRRRYNKLPTDAERRGLIMSLFM